MNHFEDYKTLLDYALRRVNLAGTKFMYCKINIRADVYTPSVILSCDLSRPVLIENCITPYIVSFANNGEVTHICVNSSSIVVVEKLSLPTADEYFLSNL
mgnify:FL=1